MRRKGAARGALGWGVALAMASVTSGCGAPDAAPVHGRAPLDPQTATVSYLVSCALPAGRSIDYAGHRLEGELGYVPAWSDRALRPAERRLLSACVLARTNRRGREVEILLDRSEASRFAPDGSVLPAPDGARLEGAFFGDLFADPPRRYACISTLDDDTRAWLESSSRECALADSGDATRCGFEFVGPCDRRAFARTEADYVDEAIFVFLPTSPRDAGAMPASPAARP